MSQNYDTSVRKSFSLECSEYFHCKCLAQSFPAPSRLAHNVRFHVTCDCVRSGNVLTERRFAVSVTRASQSALVLGINPGLILIFEKSVAI